MPIIRPRAEVGYCELDRRLIFLDVRRDRYLQIAPDLEMSFRRICASNENVDPKLASSLLQTGLFETVPEDCPARCTGNLIRPTRAIIADLHKATISKSIVNWIRAVALLAVFHGFARRKSLKSLISLATSLSKHRILRVRNGDRDTLLAVFGCAMLLFRRKDRCLPDALALFSLLAAAGCRVQITFGVQRFPFQAHCWVQQDDIVLGQDIENVQAFCPILAVP
ncbi:lasso peptide biosynthesis B2 protein [Novosphingobium resinovorum]|uniref:lasso peptide biosynthesis B2 protein n=1 Tax=Novosphingobium resinovorum TaxID=158500 RepID=UPI002ED23ECC